MAVVYQHKRSGTDEIFYIGIGVNKRRCYKWGRNPYWNNIASKGYEVEIILEDVSWEEACEEEIKLIAKYGRHDIGTGTLANMTDGGSSMYNLSDDSYKKRSATRRENSNTWHSDDTRKKIALSRVDKIGENHPKSKPIEKLDKTTKEVLEVLPNAMEAYRKYGFDWGNIRRCIKGDLKSAYGFIWRELNTSNK